MLSVEQLLADTPDHQTRSDSKDCGNLIVRMKSVDRGQFVDINFKETTLDQCQLRFGYFERCYFRNTTFKNVSFVGSRFKECNFHGAEFDSRCNLDYVEFQDCNISHAQVLRCLPERENVRHELARNLRMNAQARGNSDDYRLFLRVELKASEKHAKKKFSEFEEDYYRNKYRWHDRIKAFFEYLGLRLSALLWGYGESPSSVLRFGLGVITIFSLVFLRWFAITGLPSSAWYEYVLFSAASFTSLGYGIAFPETLTGRVFMVSESILGVIFYGLLVAVLYNRFTRR